MPQTVNEILVDKALRHAVYLEGFKQNEVNKVLRFLDKIVIPDLKKQIAGAKNSLSLQLRLAEIKAVVKEGFQQIHSSHVKRSKRFALQEAKWQQAALNDAIPAVFDVSVTLPSVQALNKIVTSSPFQGKVLRNHFSNLAGKTIRAVENAIKSGVISGETLPQIARKTQKIIEGTRRSAQTIARTSIQHISNDVRQETYKENKDVVKGWEFLATLDARTTDICAANDGKFFEVGKGSGNQPPLHMQCRSTTVPVVKSWQELGIPGVKNIPASTRASMNGQVAGKVTFGPWLMKQPIAFQNDILGKGRAALFRRGKVKIENFVNIHNRPLTLKALRKSEKLILQGKKVPRVREGKIPKQFKAAGPLLTKRESLFVRKNNLQSAFRKASLTPKELDVFKRHVGDLPRSRRYLRDVIRRKNG